MLTPEKNPAGQRVYRRRDVEIVMRIRNLLYEEKFTIAGAKKKLQEELRSRGSGPKLPPPEPIPVKDPDDLPDPEIESPSEPPAANTDISNPPETSTPKTIAAAPNAEPTTPPQTRRALRIIRRDLEDLLTLLNSDASIKN